jgi:molecular chaperone GrpE
MNEKTEQPNVHVEGKDAKVAPVAPADAKPQTPGTQPGISPEELTKLKEQAAKAVENWDRLVRISADFDNFKKRAAREKQDAIKYANEGLLSKLIPILDTFEMALAAAGADASAQSLKSGVAMIQSQLKNALAEAGLEEIDATGKAFDPNFHEAVSQHETSEVPEGHVVKQLRKGYKFRERLIRAASVVVAKTPAH